jgi:hypothetical protein
VEHAVAEAAGHRRLIIHCGAQKTASTAFHHFLARNHDALSEHLDCRTPKAGTATRQLGKLCADFSLDPTRESDLVSVISRLRDDLLKTTGPVLLSHENIPGAMMGRGGVVTLYPRIFQILNLLDRYFVPFRPEFVLFTREMAAWKSSVYNQAVKSDKYAGTRQDFLKDTRNCGTWADLKQRMCDAVGPDRVHVMALEDETDPGRPGQQVLRLAGVSEDVLAKLDPIEGRRNESLNPGSLEFMRQMNGLELPRNARRVMAQLIQNSQSLFVADEEIRA